MFYDNNAEKHPDPYSFNEIWGTIIMTYVSEFQDKYNPVVKFDKNAKEKVWNEYCRLNKHCKANYMKDNNGKLDRHKVSACYILSIALVKPLYFTTDYKEQEECYSIINEILAISVGFSVLRAYIESAIENSKYEEQKKKDLLSIYNDGIKFPADDEINHGEYIINYASELHYSVQENSINILSIAHELFLLEKYTYYNSKDKENYK